MESPQLALLLSRAAVLREVGSARPDAPVTDDRRGDRPAGRRPAVTRRTRGALATSLHRIADAVAPRPLPGCVPGRTATPAH
ncbi:hypothetical protein [Cellulomonas soli]|uniref:Uncharacterized protein n=1 Tax=Cellulomonas soli TaxID=931535 RepID=A0A512PI26_9CELL|nr:hypothetical protein [Cellulomonas soli]NYI59287.1 hypothetical protein [Cellulomonas soli]GEP70792.1 hypothetical protein CSO01_35070 [Cellulomonas soli]